MVYVGKRGYLVEYSHERYVVGKKTQTRTVHRSVMERKLGRPLLVSEIVHHVDENKLNNHPDNLCLVSSLDHNRIHKGWKKIGETWWKKCGDCQLLLEVNETTFYPRKKGKGEFSTYCRKCEKHKMILRYYAKKEEDKYDA